MARNMSSFLITIAIEGTNLDQACSWLMKKQTVTERRVTISKSSS